MNGLSCCGVIDEKSVNEGMNEENTLHYHLFGAWPLVALGTLYGICTSMVTLTKVYVAQFYMCVLSNS